MHLLAVSRGYKKSDIVIEQNIEIPILSTKLNSIALSLTVSFPRADLDLKASSRGSVKPALKAELATQRSTPL